MAGLFDKVGDFLGTSNTDQINSAQATLDDILARANSVSSQNRGLYGDYLGQMQGMYGQGAAQYGDAVARLADAIGNGPDTFSYGKGVEDFLDPYREQATAQAMDALNQSASAGGNRFSSNYNDKMAAKQRAMSTESWRTAYDTMMRDRNQQLAEWQAGQGARQQYVGNLGQVAGLYGQDRSQLSDAIGNYYGNVANQNNADLDVYSDVTQNKANLDAQRNNGITQLVGPAVQLGTALFGA